MLGYIVYFVFHIYIFLAFKQLDGPKPTPLLKNTYTYFSFTQLDSSKPIKLLKTYDKNVYKSFGFLHENYPQQAYSVV